MSNERKISNIGIDGCMCGCPFIWETDNIKVLYADLVNDEEVCLDILEKIRRNKNEMGK